MVGKGEMRVKIKPYDRAAAVAYARRWALSRNPAFYDFERVGGDCTSFASQCLYAGAGVMNFTPVMGWYYRASSDRTASWSGVEYLYNFLIGNMGAGPFARVVPREAAQPGDIVQLATADGDFFHSPVVIAVGPLTLVAAHSTDAIDRPLASYDYDAARFLHIVGVRV